MTILQLLQDALQCNASDIHISNAIYLRVQKQMFLYQSKTTTIQNNDIMQIKQELCDLLHIDNTILWNEKSKTIKITATKCRISVFQKNQELCFALRILKTQIPTLQSLNAPQVLQTLSLRSNGLILVCGATGTGKSTTLAAMIHHINTHCKKHILTIEDPIEYEHSNLQSLVTQREIKRDSKSFKNALKASLRQDPDVILVGEILDSKVLQLAIKHALSGHLVLASFHAHSCSHAISRILSMSQEDSNAYANLSDCLQGIITQRLYLENQTLQADFEILVANPAVKILIKENKINQIDSQISMGREFGMRHFSQKSASH